MVRVDIIQAISTWLLRVDADDFSPSQERRCIRLSHHGIAWKRSLKVDTPLLVCCNFSKFWSILMKITSLSLLRNFLTYYYSFTYWSFGYFLQLNWKNIASLLCTRPMFNHGGSRCFGAWANKHTLSQPWRKVIQ